MPKAKRKLEQRAVEPPAEVKIKGEDVALSGVNTAERAVPISDDEVAEFSKPEENPQPVRPTRSQTEQFAAEGRDASGQYTIQNPNMPSYQFNKEKAMAIVKGAVIEAQRMGMKVSADNFTSPAFLAGVSNDAQLVGRIIGECFKAHFSASKVVTTRGRAMAPSNPGRAIPAKEEQKPHNLYWECPKCKSEQWFNEKDACCNVVWIFSCIFQRFSI